MRAKEGQLTDLQFKLLYCLNRLPTTIYTLADLLKDNYASIGSAKTSINNSLRYLEKKGLVENISLEEFRILGVLSNMWKITDKGKGQLVTQLGEGTLLHGFSAPSWEDKVIQIFPLSPNKTSYIPKNMR